MPTARFGCPIMSRAGSRSVTGWRPEPKRRSTPWRLASALSQEGPPPNNEPRLFALAAELLELGEHGVDIELVARRLLLLGFGFATNGGLRRGEKRGALSLDVDRLLLGGAVNLEIEIDLRAEAERDRIHGLQVRGVPVGALADRLDGRLGGADEPHDLAVLELGMVAHQPEDGVRAVLAARYRRVARALLLLGLGQPHLGVEQLEAIVRIGDGFLDLLAAELTGEHGIEALDALRGVAVGDRLHLERVKLAEVGDLIEREGGVLDLPHGGCFRHQRRCGHGEISSALRPPSRAKLGVIGDDGSGQNIGIPPGAAQWGSARQKVRSFQRERRPSSPWIPAFAGMS